MRGGGMGRSGGSRSGGYGRSLGGGGGRSGRGMGRPSVPRPGAGPSRGTAGRVGSFGAGLGMGMAMGGRRRRGWGRRRGMGGGGGGCGCSTLISVIVVIVLIMAVFALLNNFGGTNMPAARGQVTESTREREPLPANAANDTGPMFTDHLNWIANTTQMQTGLINFHRATGVRPHVYIVGEINGNTAPSPAQVQDFAVALYDQLFTDEAHLLLVFFESGEFPNQITEMYIQPGVLARTVMDPEALVILADYIESYNSRFHNPGDIGEEQVFSYAFNSTAQRIMHRPPDNRPIFITVIVVSGLVLLALILFNFWKRKQEQKNLEAEQTERILSQELNTFGDSGGDEASRLEQHYKDDDDNNFR